jgi:ubiquinone/menaquinone biosynthesis C-methylase UbiE
MANSLQDDRRAAAFAEDARERFEALYERLPTWEIGRPQPAIVELWERGFVSGQVLDVGCGTGENALFLAEQGLAVWGLDLSMAAIGMARSKATTRSLPAARFLMGDALRLERLGMVFDTILDSGLFHALCDEERALYQPSLARALRPGGLCHILCYSDREPGDDGPRRIGRDELEATFSECWEVVEIAPSRIERSIQRGAAKAWLATIRRS